MEDLDNANSLASSNRSTSFFQASRTSASVYWVTLGESCSMLAGNTAYAPYTIKTAYSLLIDSEMFLNSIVPLVVLLSSTPLIFAADQWDGVLSRIILIRWIFPIVRSMRGGLPRQRPAGSAYLGRIARMLLQQNLCHYLLWYCEDNHISEWYLWGMSRL